MANKVGKGESDDVKGIGKGESDDVKGIGKGESDDVKGIGKGGLTPAAVGNLFASLGSVNGWLVVSFIAPVSANAGASAFGGPPRAIDFSSLRDVTAARDKADLRVLADKLDAQDQALKALYAGVIQVPESVAKRPK
jgi:hypothetical protein